jgi:hypothetical protein
LVAGGFVLEQHFAEDRLLAGTIVVAVVEAAVPDRL